MITKRTIYPGQPGSQKWEKMYGKDLVCIRYKYDENIKQKMITVELAVEKSEWKKNLKHIPKNKIFAVKINYGEIEVGRKARALGGKWDKINKVWRLPWDVIQALGLQDRIVENKTNYANEHPP